MLNLLCTGIDAPQRMHSAACAAAIVFCSLLMILMAPALAKTPAVSESAPDFVLKSAAGRNLRLSEFRGDVVIVNFWSTRCQRCREQLERLDAINAAGGPKRLSILSVNVDSDSSAARRVVTDQGFEFPVLFDVDKSVIRLYDPDKLPMIVMVDPHGTVRYIHEGYRTGDEALYAQELATLLTE